MKIAQILNGFALALLACISGMAQESFVDGVDLTTIKAPWTLRILGNDLDITNVQARDDASVYFMMASASTKLNVSVFIEPADKCKSSEECREHVLAHGNPAWGKFEQLSKGKIRDFSYFEFYRPEVRGQPIKMFDMYAEYVSQGYWVDVHISKALYTKADHALFEKVINSISFIPKTEKSGSAFDTQLGKARTAASSWLRLWDNNKCKESYTALSPLSKAGITETQWLGYCLRIIQDVGTNKSRKPIAAAFARPLPAKTNRPLAVLAYHSNFENSPSGVELVALLLEKDATWSITNYLLR